MANEQKVRDAHNRLAARLQKQSGGRLTHQQAKDRLNSTVKRVTRNPK